MANKKRNYSRGNTRGATRAHAKAESRDNKRWVAIALAVLFLVAAVLGVGFASHWTFWAKTDSVADVPDEGSEQLYANGGMQIEEQEKPDDPDAYGISLLSVNIPRQLYNDYGISPIAESAIQVKATVEPENAENNLLDWSLTWKNSLSAWATGKTASDYVGLSVSDDTHTATLTCKQAFGEQLEIHAEVRGDETVKSNTRTVNYVQRYSGTLTAKLTYTNADTPDANFTWNINSISATAKQNPFPGYAKTYDEFISLYGAANESKYNITVMTGLEDVYTKAATVTDCYMEIGIGGLVNNAILKAGGSKISEALKTTTHGAGVTATVTGFTLEKLFGGVEQPNLNWAIAKQQIEKSSKSVSGLSTNRENSTVYFVLHTTVNDTPQKTTIYMNFKPNTFGTFATNVDIGSGDIDM